MLPSSADDDPDPSTGSTCFGVLVSGIGDDLAQGIFGILVRLARHEDGLGQIPYPKSYLLGGHGLNGRHAERAAEMPAA